MAKKRKVRHWDEPQFHGDHPRPVTRRDFVAQGFISGSAVALGGEVRAAWAQRGQDDLLRALEHLGSRPQELSLRAGRRDDGKAEEVAVESDRLFHIVYP